MNDTKSIATKALRLLFKPVARIMLRVGMTWRELAEVCKATYVEVASEDYGIRGRPTNISRVSILTGLTRRDVRLLRNRLREDEPQSFKRMNHATRVLSGWYQDDLYCGSDGEPKSLSRDGAAPSFESLCKTYCPDVPAVTMLKELMTVGAVGEAADGKLEAKSRVYRPGPGPDDPERLLRVGGVLQDMGYTVAHNLNRSDDEPGRFERRATNTRIPESAVPAFREFIEQEGQAFLERVDAWLTENEQSAVDGSKHVRLGMGTYWIEQKSDEGQDQ